jgi:hypothetical protein
MSEEPDKWLRIFMLGKAIGLTDTNLKQMKRRKKVPAKHHHSLLVAAEKSGMCLTYQELTS